MKIIFTVLFGLLCMYDVFSQELSTRRRAHETTSSGAGEVSTPYHDAQGFESMDDCQATGCPCCIFMHGASSDGSAAALTVCQTDGLESDDVEDIWGISETVTINGLTFNIFNANTSQSALIQEVLSVLPSFYLEAVPQNIRIGDPLHGTIQTSATASMHTVTDHTGRTRQILKGDQYEETIGGGSRRCSQINDIYEYIILHPLTFTIASENPRMTLLHEIGHFVDREFAISDHQIREHRSEFRGYLSSYRGDSRGNDEVIAQGIMYYFHQKYWLRGVRRTATRILPSPRFPAWLRDIIQADIESRS
ncbi:MAG: hypothetical protein WBP41_14180 [Saprospiraceae bacterium]